ncbi:mitochondrial import inner membrane translocase subunit tim54 [Mucor velutinosus]|uniref:Mitochondrial import inner membrane translocase subunit tim54 n=1 Tax=Mucor velutinosus TaxID=708070 RepID=A0AAN7DMB4_9FUNG|nr:mitochondrial import inner membrane translocase subunit tim54 [Mucor velutinosus]
MENNMDNDCPRYRPFASSTTAQRIVKVKKAKYSTSLDPRGYIPVYEYLINGQPIMWDRESGYVHFTGIWKSLGNSKADIVKMVDSNPELKVKKIRGGFLKIQGTWIPYEYAYLLCKRTAWMIRRDLVAMFGPRFLNDALDPSHPEYGCLLLDPKCNQKGMNNRQTTMRHVNHHPYKRSDFMRRNSLDKLIKKNDKIVSSMSLSRLLNTSAADTKHGQQSNDAAFSESPNTTPSPTFRVVPLPLASRVEKETHLLPPILTNKPDRRSSEPRITPIYSPSSPSTSSTWPSPSSPSALSSSHSSSDLMLPPPTHTYSKDIIDTINATILLQRLSQDDGARPFKPMHLDSIPSKVIVGNQEYRICWDD